MTETTTTTTLPESLELISGSSQISMKLFYKCWQVDTCVLAERLRDNGYNVTNSQIKEALSSDMPSADQEYLLKVGVLILKNDILKIGDLYV